MNYDNYYAVIENRCGSPQLVKNQGHYIGDHPNRLYVYTDTALLTLVGRQNCSWVKSKKKAIANYTTYKQSQILKLTQQVKTAQNFLNNAGK